VRAQALLVLALQLRLAQLGQERLEGRRGVGPTGHEARHPEAVASAHRLGDLAKFDRSSTNRSLV
jgi:hypothetical protein